MLLTPSSFMAAQYTIKGSKELDVLITNKMLLGGTDKKRVLSVQVVHMTWPLNNVDPSDFLGAAYVKEPFLQLLD